MSVIHRKKGLRPYCLCMGTIALWGGLPRGIKTGALCLPMTHRRHQWECFPMGKCQGVFVSVAAHRHDLGRLR